MRLVTSSLCTLALAVALIALPGCGGGEEGGDEQANNSTSSNSGKGGSTGGDTETEEDGEYVKVSLELPGMT